MMLFTKEITRQLVRNGEIQAKADVTKPIVKLFMPDAGATWLLTEVDPEELTRAFGLCDLGFGFPELGYIDLNEIRELRGCLGLPVERDKFFRPDKTLQQYADKARAAGRIRA